MKTKTSLKAGEELELMHPKNEKYPYISRWQFEGPLKDGGLNNPPPGGLSSCDKGSPNCPWH